MVLFAVPAISTAQTQTCDPNTGAGCITFTLADVNVGAGTVTGSNGITAQVNSATMFLHPPSPNCVPSDPFYPWQQLVYAGANEFDPSRYAFLGLLAGWSQKPPSPNDTQKPPNPNFYVSLDGFNNLISMQPISCSGQ